LSQNLTTWLFLAGLLIFSSSLNSCQFDDELPFAGSSQRRSVENNSDNASMRHPQESMFGSGQAEIDDSGLTNESYPLLTMKAGGSLDHRKGSARIEQDMTAHVTADKYEFNVTRFAATGGDQRKRVHDRIKNQTGVTQGRRTERARARTLQRNENFEYQPFVIFADSVSSQDGRTYAFATPLPVFVSPAALARYESLDDGPLTYTTNVSGTSSFTVNTTIRRSSPPNDPNVRITIENVIPEDSQGRLYQAFPFARESQFYIDTREQTLRRVDMTRIYHDDDRKTQRLMHLNYRVCNANQNGSITQIEGC